MVEDPAVAEGRRTSVARPLLAFGVVVSLTHHLGLLTNPLGRVGTVHWNDWLDLVVPYLVIGTALSVLLAARPARTDRPDRPDRLVWGVFVVGAITYVEGHGIHLAGNSIDNADHSRTAHLWDEIVGHAVWFSGLGLLVLALVLALRTVPLHVTWPGWVVAAAFGATVASNAFGGNTVPGSLPASVALASYGLLRRDPLGYLLVVAFGVAALGILAHLVV